jgi:hypothetical protein
MFLAIFSVYIYPVYGPGQFIMLNIGASKSISSRAKASPLIDPG